MPERQLQGLSLNAMAMAFNGNIADEPEPAEYTLMLVGLAPVGVM
jgi:hypothetical protein